MTFGLLAVTRLTVQATAAALRCIPLHRALGLSDFQNGLLSGGDVFCLSDALCIEMAPLKRKAHG